MNIYLLGRLDGAGYDEVEEFVISAPDANTARQMAAKAHADEGPDFWFDTSKTKIRKVGEATNHTTPWIICRATKDG